MTETGEEIKATEGEAEQPWEIEKKRKKALVAMPHDEYDKMMVAKFPGIFADRHKSMMETCMCWGFEVGPGWHALIHDLCVKLAFMCDKFGVKLVADQVKEKFGGLRFYYHTELTGGATEEGGVIACGIIDDLVDRAESESCFTCEACGEHGDRITICGWVSTLCSKHIAERKESREQLFSKPDSEDPKPTQGVS